MGPIKKLKLLMLLSSVYNDISKVLKGEKGMKLRTNAILQVLAIGVQGAVHLGKMFPEYEAAISVSVGLVQAISAVLAHFFNTNGTPQEAPGGKNA